MSQGWGQESVDKETSLYIEQLKNDDDWRKRSQAASALGEIGSETAIPALITALKTEQDEVVRLEFIVRQDWANDAWSYSASRWYIYKFRNGCLIR
ncbi:HEAT repeat domain-containing protein [Coleofasciculus sp. F4-SAH-05]|uniref:HEAT repeat domain-containing protein n=1 Tax=Coleofasciculus sp. F4-SAH-05 TaxID=3069525 RepID=UPI0032FE5AA1